MPRVHVHVHVVGATCTCTCTCRCRGNLQHSSDLKPQDLRPPRGVHARHRSHRPTRNSAHWRAAAAARARCGAMSHVSTRAAHVRYATPRPMPSMAMRGRRAATRDRSLMVAATFLCVISVFAGFMMVGHASMIVHMRAIPRTRHITSQATAHTRHTTSQAHQQRARPRARRAQPRGRWQRRRTARK